VRPRQMVLPDSDDVGVRIGSNELDDYPTTTTVVHPVEHQRELMGRLGRLNHGSI